MADVRALLKAKRHEARITHPLAFYTKTGQLRCSACGTLVSAWEGHLGSKLHRTTVARLKEEERAKEARRLEEEHELEQVVRGKRKAEGQDSDSEESDVKRRRTDPLTDSFPADFFSDPSRAVIPPSDDSGDEADNLKSTAPTTEVASTLDLEWEQFQRDVVNAPDPNVLDLRDTYERATVMAEPELASETPEGFPSQEVEASSALPSKMDEEEARRKKEQDDRELIMDRLFDEERAQEEADLKVTVMKGRLEALKKKREAARASKSKA